MLFPNKLFNTFYIDRTMRGQLIRKAGIQSGEVANFDRTGFDGKFLQAVALFT